MSKWPVVVVGVFMNSEQGACIIWRPDGVVGESEYALVMNDES